MGKKYLLGIDIGSSAVKTTLITTDGEIAATAVKEYPTYYPHISWAEQDTEDWWNAFKVTFRDMLSKACFNPKDIMAIALDALTHTAVMHITVK